MILPFYIFNIYTFYLYAHFHISSFPLLLSSSNLLYKRLSSPPNAASCLVSRSSGPMSSSLNTANYHCRLSSFSAIVAHLNYIEDFYELNLNLKIMYNLLICNYKYFINYISIYNFLLKINIF